MSRWWRSWIGSPMAPLTSDEHGRILGMPHPGAVARLATERGQRFDVDFVPVMIAHHRGAVQMAEDAWSEASDPRVRLLADSIRHAQIRQIAAMVAMAR